MIWDSDITAAGRRSRRIDAGRRSFHWAIAMRLPEVADLVDVVRRLHEHGPNLYATAAKDPDLVVARIPEAERRFMTEILLAASGPWEPTAQEAIRKGLAAADVRRAGA